MAQRDRRRSSSRFAGCVVVLALLTSSCGTTGAAERPEEDALTIAATTTIMGDVVRNVAPGTADVSVLMPPGTDPHTYEPSARQLAELQQMDLVVANGGGLEAGLQSALDDAERAGVPVFSALEHVTPLADGDAEGGEGEDHDDATHDDHGEDSGSEHGEDSGSEHGDDPDDHAEDPDDHAEDPDDHPEDPDDHPEDGNDDVEDEGSAAATADDGHDHGAVDPHFWMDPIRMAEAVDALGARIGELTGTARRSADRARRYGAELRDLDGRISVLLDDVPADRRTIVTNHEALAYFADRYDLRVVGTVIPSMSTGAAPSARDIEQLAAVLRREAVTTIFAESTAPQQLAETLADEVGGDAEVVVLFTESVGGDDSPGTYIDMLGTDAELISEALRR